MIDKYARFLIRWRYLVIVATLAVVAVLASGGRFLQFTNDYRVFFGESNPQLEAFENLQDSYTKNDNVLIMLLPSDGDVFSGDTLEAIKELTTRAWQIPFSIRVDSIANFQHTSADGDDLLVEDLVDEVDGLSDQDRETIREIALREPILVNRLVSPDSRAAAVNVTVELPGVDPTNEVPEVVAYARSIVADFEARYPDIAFHVSGVVMMNNAFPEASKADMSLLVPLAFVVIVVSLVLFLRNIPAAIATVIVVILSILAAMGTTGWLGIKLTPPSASAPTLILTLAVADCVHFLTTFLHSMRAGAQRHDAVIESLRVNFHPIFLTSLTTIIGFLSLNFSDSPPFHDLGNITAIGVAYAFVLSVLFLPAFVAVLPVRARREPGLGGGMMGPLAEFVIRRRRALLIVMGVISIALIAQIPRNELNDVFVEYFDTSIDFRNDTDMVTEHLTGLYFIDYSLDSKESGGISRPEFLEAVKRFTLWLRSQPEVIHVSAITDIFERLNKNMHADDEAWYRLPEQRDLAAQYLLLYEMSLPYGLDLNNQIDVDKASTRLSVSMHTISTRGVIEFESRAKDWMQANTPDLVTQGASPTVMFSHIGARNIRSMLWGTTLALVLISLVLIFALRSLKLGLISLVPNLLPAGIAFGIWGIFVGEIGLALSVVMGMTLGIVVDDTVHFLSKYLRARRERGCNAEDAVRYAFSSVGIALWVTTVVLVAGFLVLSLSAFELNAGMGLLTAVTITIALIVDFLLLPPLLMIFKEVA
ncbi:MAG: MMPL family transporter [Pseudomonadota bacterium]|nr:MMPL family transporter [Pseudomonadota bacterium]